MLWNTKDDLRQCYPLFCKLLLWSHGRVTYSSFLKSSSHFGKERAEFGNLMSRDWEVLESSQLLYRWVCTCSEASPSILGEALAVSLPSSCWLFLTLQPAGQGLEHTSEPPSTWCPSKMILPSPSQPPPRWNILASLSSLSVFLPCICGRRRFPFVRVLLLQSLAVGGVRGVIFHQIRLLSISQWLGWNLSFPRSPVEMLAAEMHISIKWKGLGYFIKMVVLNPTHAWPSRDHIIW